MTDKNIVLIGFMGVGKSLCSKMLGDILNREVISTDAEIERREGSTIAEIFQNKGEAYFRDLEAQVVRDITTMPSQIIDTGGGVILNIDNVVALQKTGMLIWLKALPEEIWANVNAQSHQRPLLDVKDPQAKIKELLTERTPFYSQADISIAVGGKTVNQICTEIIGMLPEK